MLAVKKGPCGSLVGRFLFFGRVWTFSVKRQSPQNGLTLGMRGILVQAVCSSLFFELTLPQTACLRNCCLQQIAKRDRQAKNCQATLDSLCVTRRWLKALLTLPAETWRTVLSRRFMAVPTASIASSSISVLLQNCLEQKLRHNWECIIYTLRIRRNKGNASWEQSLGHMFSTHHINDRLHVLTTIFELHWSRHSLHDGTKLKD